MRGVPTPLINIFFITLRNNLKVVQKINPTKVTTENQGKLDPAPGFKVVLETINI